MPDSFSRDEFAQLMKPWVFPEREIAEERLATNFRKDQLERFTEEEAAVMRVALDRLIPQEEEIDLVGFIDTYIEKPLGRGDRKPGMPDALTIIKKGLQGLNDLAQSAHGVPFTKIGGEQADELLRQCQEGEAKGGVWDEIPSQEFFQKLYSKALHGYFAHPKSWMRIGFMGAAYPEGYRWLGRAQVQQRHNREIGWEVM